MKRLAVFLCLLVAGASLCHAQVPQALVQLNGSSFVIGNFVDATFVLYLPIEQPFTVFAVIFLPDGSMLDLVTLGPHLKPIASDIPGLDPGPDPPSLYPLMYRQIPPNTVLGEYEVMVAFFDPSKLHGQVSEQDAFLVVSAEFVIKGDDTSWYAKYGPAGTGDVVLIGSTYVASKKDGLGCAGGSQKDWDSAVSWAGGLDWLEKTDWRLPAGDEHGGELNDICAVKDTASGFTYEWLYYWTSTEQVGDLSRAFGVYFSDCYPLPRSKLEYHDVRAVR